MELNNFEMLKNSYEILKEYEGLYGEFSLATVFIKYNILTTALNLKVNNLTENELLTKEVNNAAKLVQKHYENSNRKQVPSTKKYMWTVESKYKELDILIYDRNKYDEIYSDLGFEIQSLVKVLSEDNHKDIIPRKSYMYAINSDMEPVIYLKPISYQDLIFGRQRLKLNNGRVAHPVLLHNYGLKAIGAGEVIFIKNEVSSRIEGLIINNKSGHYRPSGKSLEMVKKSFMDSLNIDFNNVISIEVEKDWGRNGEI